MRFYQLLTALLGLFLEREVFTGLAPLKLPVQVVEVLDGDTLVVRQGRGRWRLRLAGIDAPEKGQLSRHGELDAGRYAASCLKRSLSHQSWSLRWRSRDIYGRVLGELWHDEEKLSHTLLRKGCVSVYPFLSDYSAAERRELRQLLGEAQRARVGLWARGGFMRPRAWRRLQKTRRTPVAAE